MRIFPTVKTDYNKVLWFRSAEMVPLNTLHTGHIGRIDMTGFDIIFSIVMIVTMLLIAISMFYESKTDIASVPTMPWVQKRMIAALKRKYKPDQPYKFAELGSGWGTLVFGLTKAFPKAQITGYEMSPIPLYVSKLLNKIFGSDRIDLQKDDFFTVDLSDMDMVIFYLSGRHAIRLKDKLEAELKPGAVVVSNSFPVPGWTPRKVVKTNVFMELSVYIYVMPAAQDEVTPPAAAPTPEAV